MLSAVYSRRVGRRQSHALGRGPDRRRGPEAGAWRKPTAERRQATDLGIVHARSWPGPTDVGEAVAPDAQPPGDTVTAVALDWPRLARFGVVAPAEAGPLAAPLRHLGARLTEPAMPARRDRLLLITSSGPGEGKSFVALALALGLARERRQILLIDATSSGARPGGASHLLGLPPGPGLTDALADPTLDPGRLIRPTEVDGLALLGAGSAAAAALGPHPGTGPAAVLRLAERLGAVLGTLLTRTPGRLILLDGPALLGGDGADPAGPHGALALAWLSGHVVVVVRAGTTRRRSLADALARLGAHPGRLLLLNGAPFGDRVAASAEGADEESAGEAIRPGTRDRAASDRPAG